MSNALPDPRLPLPILPEAASSDKVLLAALAQWNIARQTELVPDRASLRFRNLIACLPNIVLFEVLDNDVVIRLAGTKTREYFGFEITNRSLKETSDPQGWATRVSRIRKMVTYPCGWWFQREVNLGGAEKTKIGVLCLPLKNIGASKNIGFLSVLIGLPLYQQMPRQMEGSLAFGKALRVSVISIGAGVPDSLD